jgi:hypothetical protein
MDRHAKFLWMKDLLEHLGRCHEQWQLSDAPNEHYLAESMRRDLDEFRRLCESLRCEGRPRLHAGAAA